MATIRFRYVDRFKDRHGTWRYYFRRATAAANSVDGVAVGYYRSPNFLSLNKSTQTTYRREIERWRERNGAKAISRLERRHIKEQMTERFEAGVRSGKQSTPRHSHSLRLRSRTRFTPGQSRSRHQEVQDAR
jgi:hypothetical protein